MNDFLIGLLIAVTSSGINFITQKTYNYITGDLRNFFWKKKYIQLARLPFLDDFEEIRKRTRIVVIDDENSFPIEIFQNEGYSIDKWDIVKEYSKLENGFYDIIILDIKGVALHISKEDGLGVLISLKENNPAQIVVSFSQHSYDLDKLQFFQLADDNIAKPSDYLRIKKVLDNLITTKFKPERYIKTFNELLRKNNYSAKVIRRININISRSISNNKRIEWREILKVVYDSNSELYNQLTNLGNTIIKFHNA